MTTAKRRFAWYRDDIEISQCIDCKRWQQLGSCEAFPDGVPDAILTNVHDHRQPYAGDQGIRFEAIGAKGEA